jgi:prephenate dehydratase
MSNKTGGPVKVAFQGANGAFSEEAARKLLDCEIETLACRSFEETFSGVSSGAADCVVAPIENSLAGSVHKSYDLLQEHDLQIIGELNLRIVHNLIAAKGVELSDVRRVYSHPVALAQCERFLASLSRVEALPAYDTAGSVKMVLETARPDEAAIAGAEAAKVYGGVILAEGIEDNAQNYTRFLLLTRTARIAAIKVRPTSGPRKTSIVFRVANRPGALFKSLAAFALRDIDLSKIESRPIEGRPWEYSFYLDLIGDSNDPRVERSLSHLEELAESVRVLGCYTADDNCS